MTDTLAPSIPAGWYDDPSNPATFRWWSGTEWTSYTSPKQPSAVVAPEQSAQTRGIWLLAFLPAMVLTLVGIAFVAVVSGAPSFIPLTAWPVAIGLAVWFGWLDTRELQRRGYRPPSLLWMLLFPPLGYLIARGRMIRAQGGSAWGPELVYVLGGLLGTVIVLSISAQMVYAQTHTTTPSAAVAPAADGQEYYAGTYGDTGTPASDSLEQMLTAAVAPTDNLGIDCSDAIVARGSYFSCVGSDSGASYLINVHICDCGDVYFSYTAVGPPAPTDSALEGEELHGTGNGAIMVQQFSAGVIPDQNEVWQPQIEESLGISGDYTIVDCSADADLIDTYSTFECLAATADGGIYSLDVSITQIGEITYTPVLLEQDTTV